MKKIDYKKISDKIIKFLQKEFKKSGKKVAILGLSGGIDSTLSGFLCKKAGLDLYGIILPYENRHLKESKMAAEFLKLPKNKIFTVNVAPAVDAQVKELKKSIKIGDIDRGNMMARQRMIIQYAIARQLNGLVIGTENLSEYYLGYFTLHGDQACDISPISSLFKTQVYEMAASLGFPEWVLKRAPTAGLWDGQTDEGEFGFSYKDADEILHLYFAKKYPVQKIIKQGFDKKLINKVLVRAKATDFKRQNPPKC